MKKIFLVFIVLTFLLNMGLVSSEINPNVCSENFNPMNPSYSLIIRNNKQTINKGESANFEIYISGFGGVSRPGKLFVMYPTGFVDEETIHSQIRYLDIPEISVEEGEPNPAIALDDICPKIKEFDGEGLVIRVPTGYFNQIYIPDKDCFGLKVGGEVKADKDNAKYPPYSITVTTSRKAQEGDNKLKFVLAYSSGGNWYQDKEEVTIHVNSWREEHETESVVLTSIIITIIIAIGSIIWVMINEKITHIEKTSSRFFALMLLYDILLVILYRMQILNITFVELVCYIGIPLGVVLLWIVRQN